MNCCEICVESVQSADNIADIFTKALPRDKFENHQETLGLFSLFVVWPQLNPSLDISNYEDTES